MTDSGDIESLGASFKEIKHFGSCESSETTEDVQYKTFMVKVKDIVLADNIRPHDEEFTENLADNIETHGQLQPCIGYEKTLEDGSKFVVLIAGQHRYKAILLINKRREERDEEAMFVMVNVANRELTPEEIVEIQMSENLQNKMTAAQDARVIHDLWHKLKVVREESGKKLSMAEFARRVGRSPKTVSDAIKYVEGVDSIIQELVDQKLLPYTQAILLANIDDLIKKEDGSEITDEDRKHRQVRLAQYFISQKFNLKKAKEYLQMLRQEKKFVGPLYGGDWEEMERRNILIAIRTAADRAGRDATGWFVRMMRTAEILKEEQGAVEVSKGIVSNIDALEESLDDFNRDFRPLLI